MNLCSRFRRLKLAMQLALLALLISGLLACQPQAVRQPAPGVMPSGAVDTSGAVRYEVDGAASQVHILVYRGGAMAALGHNHVVSSTSVSGVLYLHSDIARSHIELNLPVPSLIVDDPQSRLVEGPEFAAEVPEGAREGTRLNLQRPEVLDGESYPIITLNSVAVSGSRGNPMLTMRVTIKRVTRDVMVPATVKEAGDQLVAKGEFAIRQSDFGITPFSVALGALQVQDQLRIKFAITCRQQN
jgi:polyisoprenoid-binding protein YceI